MTFELRLEGGGDGHGKSVRERVLKEGTVMQRPRGRKEHLVFKKPGECHWNWGVMGRRGLKLKKTAQRGSTQVDEVSRPAIMLHV